LAKCIVEYSAFDFELFLPPSTFSSGRRLDHILPVYFVPDCTYYSRVSYGVARIESLTQRLPWKEKYDVYVWQHSPAGTSVLIPSLT